MAILEPILDKDQDVLRFHLAYTKNHLYWMQYFKNKIGITPRLVYLHADRVMGFFPHDSFVKAKQHWHTFRKNSAKKLRYHIRILEFANNLQDLISHWYPNLKQLTVHTQLVSNCFQITLIPPPKLRQFLIGKNGAEIEMLTQFLKTTLEGNYNFHLIIK